MRHVTVQIGGKLYGFLYNAFAMIHLQSIADDAHGLMDFLNSDNMEKTMQIADELSDQSYCAKKAMSQTPYEKFQSEKVAVIIKPAEWNVFKLAIARAINEGFRREVEDEGDIDVTLQEIQKKTNNG